MKKDEVQCLIAGFLCGFLIGIGACGWAYRIEAVEKGKAEYYIDGNNNKQWRWKP